MEELLLCYSIVALENSMDKPDDISITYAPIPIREKRFISTP